MLSIHYLKLPHLHSELGKTFGSRWLCLSIFLALFYQPLFHRFELLDSVRRLEELNVRPAILARLKRHFADRRFSDG